MESPAASENTQRRRSDRRKGSDWLMRLLAALNLSCWGLLLLVLNLAHFAKPEFNSGLVQYWGLAVDTSWDAEQVKRLQLMLYCCLCFTLLTLLIHQFRNRRRSDGKRLNLLFVALACSVALYIFSTL
jgi:hypothetical protein